MVDAISSFLPKFSTLIGTRWIWKLPRKRQMLPTVFPDVTFATSEQWSSGFNLYSWSPLAALHPSVCLMFSGRQVAWTKFFSGSLLTCKLLKFLNIFSSALWSGVPILAIYCTGNFSADQWARILPRIFRSGGDIFRVTLWSRLSLSIKFFPFTWQTLET